MGALAYLACPSCPSAASAAQNATPSGTQASLFGCLTELESHLIFGLLTVCMHSSGGCQWQRLHQKWCVPAAGLMLWESAPALARYMLPQPAMMSGVCLALLIRQLHKFLVHPKD